MWKEVLKKYLARKAKLSETVMKSEDLEEIRSAQNELLSLNEMIAGVNQAITKEEDEERARKEAEEAQKAKDEEEFRSEKGAEAIPDGELVKMSSYVIKDEREEARKAKLAEAEERGKTLKEGRAITIKPEDGANIVVPKHYADDIRPTFSEVSSLIDRVTHKFLPGGESYTQPYLVGYGNAGYTTEGGNYFGSTSPNEGDSDVTFGYATINRTKITSYAEDSEELQKLPAADYHNEVIKGIRVASRKRITRDILVGDGSNGQLMGIFNTDTIVSGDISINKITNTTLDEIIFSYGGDEDVEDPAVLILNKKDLKAFSQLRSWDGKRIHNIVTNGNTGNIDGIPFIINSACAHVGTASDGDYCMAYGPLSNYQLTIFSDFEVKQSDDYKFKQGMIAHRSVVFAGGNVVSHNGFLRVKKTATPDEEPNLELAVLKLGSDDLLDGADAGDTEFEYTTDDLTNTLTVTTENDEAEVQIELTGDATIDGKTITWNGADGDVIYVIIVVHFKDKVKVYRIEVSITE